jgi:hypothetical protein
VIDPITGLEIPETPKTVSKTVSKTVPVVPVVPETDTNFNINRTSDGRIKATNVGMEQITVLSLSIPTLSTRDDDGNIVVTSKPDRRRFVYKVEGSDELYRGNVALGAIDNMPKSLFGGVKATVTFRTTEIDGVLTRFDDSLSFNTVVDDNSAALAIIAKIMRGEA